MSARYSILLALLLVGPTTATTGYDFIQPTSTATFQCLKNNGINFVIPRIFTSVGTLDETGIQNVKNAHAAGIPEVDGYLFPCLRSNCPSAANQVRTTLNRLSAVGTNINTLWLDIERLAWPANHASNRQFIQAMVAEAQAMHQKVGIYSNYYNWQEIVGLDYTGQSSLLLWWANYDGVEDFRYFRSFGGWSKPYIHQWHGTENGACGVSVDVNWKQ